MVVVLSVNQSNDAEGRALDFGLGLVVLPAEFLEAAVDGGARPLLANSCPAVIIF